jgi:hypothetical protein
MNPGTTHSSECPMASPGQPDAFTPHRSAGLQPALPVRTLWVNSTGQLVGRQKPANRSAEFTPPHRTKGRRVCEDREPAMIPRVKRAEARAPVPERGAVTRSTLKSEGLPGFFLLPKAPIALSSSLTTGRWGDLHLTGILCGRTARFPTGRIADFPIGGPVRRPGAPTRRTACGLGNPRYGRLGSLRYEKTASSPPTDLKTMKCP